MSPVEIIVLVLSLLIIGAVFAIKTKKHANDTRIRRPGPRPPNEK